MGFKLIGPKHFEKQIQHLDFKSKKKTKGPKRGIHILLCLYHTGEYYQAMFFSKSLHASLWRLFRFCPLLKPCKAWFKRDNDFNTKLNCKFSVLVGMFHRPKRIESNQQFTLNWRKDIVCNRVTAWTDYGEDTFFKIKKGNPIEEIAREVYAQMFREKVTPLTSRYTSQGGQLKRRSNQENVFIVIVKGFFVCTTTEIVVLAVITIALVKK